MNRDQIAIEAMKSLIVLHPEYTPEQLASVAYRIADAMISTASQRQQQQRW